ncbi:hypothetical protein C0V70_16630 [Bacteriovorax stolpii]|uniref:Uncharacterized protein n=1 Tax=Bacteriovorax stolpii TaxID=960 RepID=A0A2K9NW07_BACTC|nr:glycoside hydrolase family 25 protein [Bacteriovorax stolpii]AUN99702.1 hypothetical protein C0V70_16630 [Bacteriovorax stolpii]TDP51335.1 glycosyl hydrolase family 25 [Bacteriovorax stolpii]
MKHVYLALFIALNIFSTNSHAFGAKRPSVPSSGSGSSGGSSGGGTTTPTTPSTGAAFSSPWNQSGTSIIIDAYEGNSIDWDKMSKDTKVAAVIHRSGMGLKIDSQYKARKKIALERGYLWGAYHLGTRGNTIAQADFFLSLVQDEPNTLMVLDLEDTGASNFMSVDEAVVFMNYVYEKTGRVPVVYANHATTTLLNSKVKNQPLFQRSKLWYARFKSSVTDFPTGIWSNYFMWQFSSEINCTSTGSCLYNVPGTKYDMDVNVYYGSPTDLALQWNND